MKRTTGIKRFLLAGGIALAVAAGIGPSLAWDSFSTRWWIDPDVIERVGLTELQIDQIDRIAFDWKEQKIDLKADVERAELDVWRLLDRDVIDEAAAEKAVEEMVEARCALERGEQEHRLEVAKVLTREQRQELMRMKEEFKLKMMKKWKRSSERSKKESGPTGKDPSSP
jgi:Spy/CpxP family protein refolding chaperone